MRVIWTLLLALSIVIFAVGCDFFGKVRFYWPGYSKCDPYFWPNGTISEVQARLDRGANVSEMIRKNSIHAATPLHIAAKCNSDPEVTALLIEYGADVHAKDSLGNTPLYDATRNSDAHTEVIALLLEHGADPTTEAYEEICAHPDAPCRIVRTTILYSAIYFPLGTSAAKLLLKNGADAEVNTLGTAGGYLRAPLHSAAMAGEPDEIRLLLEYGADVNLRDPKGNTPLHHTASSFQDPSLAVQIMLSNGADVNAKNKVGTTPLHGAARNPYFNVVRLLLNHGADVNEIDARRNTPLHSFMHPYLYPPNPEIIATLLNYGADPNAKNDESKTPLHEAVWLNLSPHKATQREKVSEIIELMLEHGADIDAETDYGQTPCEIAEEHDRDAARRILCQ